MADRLSFWKNGVCVYMCVCVCGVGERETLRNWLNLVCLASYVEGVELGGQKWGIPHPR